MACRLMKRVPYSSMRELGLLTIQIIRMKKIDLFFWVWGAPCASSSFATVIAPMVASFE